MTITLNDEQAHLLAEMVEAGAARSPEGAIDQAVRALHSSTTGKRPVHQQVDNLADLFAKSPFRGLNMDFERDKGSPAVFTPDNEPYLGLQSVLWFDRIIVWALESNLQVAAYTHSHMSQLSALQKAGCQIIPQGVNIALSIR